MRTMHNTYYNSNYNSADLEQKELFIVVSDDKYFLSHRLEIGKTVAKAGWNVTVVGGKNGGEEEIRKNGFDYIELPRPDSGYGVLSATKCLLKLTALFNAHPEAVIHLVGLKMILLGNLAARLSGSRGGIANAVSGLGINFSNLNSRKAHAIINLLKLVRRRHGNVVNILQNHDDEKLLKNHGVISDEEIEFIKGSGVDLDKFKYRPISKPLPNGRLRVIFSGRLLKSKGVYDLVEAAEILRPRWGDKVEFLVCGDCHFNPDSLTEEEMRSLCDNEYIVWKGFQHNMHELLNSSRFIAFPSYYREGVPLALIEASAIGLPIVTCDSVGCRDTIDRNGFAVPPKDPVELAKKIETLLLDEKMCISFGQRSRALAERDYNIDNVVGRHMKIYSRLLHKTRSEDQPDFSFSPHLRTFP